VDKLLGVKANQVVTIKEGSSAKNSTPG